MIIFKDRKGNLISEVNNRELPITIGRFPDNKIIVNDKHVSRRQCLIYEEDSHVMINDLNSKNGTYLNKKIIKIPNILKENDLVQIGDSVLIIQFVDK